MEMWKSKGRDRTAFGWGKMGILSFWDGAGSSVRRSRGRFFENSHAERRSSLQIRACVLVAVRELPGLLLSTRRRRFLQHLSRDFFDVTVDQRCRGAQLALNRFPKFRIREFCLLIAFESQPLGLDSFADLFAGWA